MVTKTKTEETLTPVEETKTAETVKVDEAPFTPQLMTANTAPVPEVPKLFKVTVSIGSIMYEKGTFTYGAILTVNEDEYRRLKDYVKLIP